MAQLLFLFGLLFCFSSAQNPIDELVFVQVVHRHGHRTPIPIDPFAQHLWTEYGFPESGILTHQGYVDAHIFGQYLRRQYIESYPLIPHVYNHSLINVRSTDIDRCLITAAMAMRELYPNIAVPIHTISLSQDLLLLSAEFCPSYYADRVFTERKLNEQFSFEYPDLIENLYNVTGWNSADSTPTQLVFDTSDNMVAQEVVGYEADPYIIENRDLILQLKDRYYSEIYQSHDPNDIRGPVGSPLIRGIVEDIQTFLDGGSSVRLNIYSANDITLVALLQSLGLTDRDLLSPHFTASVIFEVFRDTTGQFNIRASYGERKGDDYEVDNLYLNCPAPALSCTLTTFLEYTLSRNPPWTNGEGCCHVGAAFSEIGCNNFADPDTLGERACAQYRQHCPDVSCGSDHILDAATMLCVEAAKKRI